MTSDAYTDTPTNLGGVPATLKVLKTTLTR